MHINWRQKKFQISINLNSFINSGKYTCMPKNISPILSFGMFLVYAACYAHGAPSLHSAGFMSIQFYLCRYLNLLINCFSFVS